MVRTVLIAERTWVVSGPPGLFRGRDGGTSRHVDARRLGKFRVAHRLTIDRVLEPCGQGQNALVSDILERAAGCRNVGVFGRWRSTCGHHLDRDFRHFRSVPFVGHARTQVRADLPVPLFASERYQTSGIWQHCSRSRPRPVQPRRRFRDCRRAVRQHPCRRTKAFHIAFALCRNSCAP